MTITVARKPTHRAFDDCLTTWAARSGVSSNLRRAGGAVKRSTGAGVTGGRVAGRRCSGSSLSGSSPGVSVIGLLEPFGRSSASDATGRRSRRDDARLAQGDGERPEGDLARVDGQDTLTIDRDREAVHAPRRRSVLGAIGLDPETVV